MKTTILFFSIFCALILSGCQKEKSTLISTTNEETLACPVESINGPTKKLIGKWKLVRQHTGFVSDGPRSIDYSCNHIVFHFRADGIVEVTSDVEQYKSGESSYEFALTRAETSTPHERYTVKFNNSSYQQPCDIRNDGRELIITSPTDGPTEFFIRIK